jgi:hypothetical protein
MLHIPNFYISSIRQEIWKSAPCKPAVMKWKLIFSTWEEPRPENTVCRKICLWYNACILWILWYAIYMAWYSSIHACIFILRKAINKNFKIRILLLIFQANWLTERLSLLCWMTTRIGSGTTAKLHHFKTSNKRWSMSYSNCCGGLDYSLDIL